MNIKLVYFCFFLSGFSALIYEVAWLNRIQLIMGHTVYALATTLAAYLSGLALGAIFTPHLKRSKISSLWLYLIVELIIGAYGLFFYPFLKGIEVPYSALVVWLAPSLSVLSLLQFITCGFLIFIPTLLMGTTLPLLAHYLYTHDNEIAIKIPSLYGVNTMGACLGVFLTGYAILPCFGYGNTIYFAAGINMTLFLIGSIYFTAEKRPSWQELKSGVGKIFKSTEPVASFSDLLSGGDLSACVILFVSGFVSMMVQVIWNRLAALGFGPSTYIFPLVTSIVLLGIVLGSFLFRKISDNFPAVDRFFVLLPALAAFLLLVGNYFFTRTPYFILTVHQKIQPGFFLYVLLSFVWTAFCLLPVSLTLGALFPVASSVLTRNKKSASNSLAFGYALNVLGLMIGGIAGAFFILPFWGVDMMSKLVFIILIMAAVLLNLQYQWYPHVAIVLWILGGISLKIVPDFDRLFLTSGFFYNRVPEVSATIVKSRGYLGYLDYFKLKEFSLLAYHDDPHATISIHEDVTDPTLRFFRINGKVDGNNKGDLRTTRLLAIFPLLVHSQAENVLTIGLGTGATVSETLSYPGLKKTKVIELSKAMIEFSKKYFPEVNEKIWHDPRFSVENRDGREFLRHTKEKFDLIISEPSNPWVDGVASLFTQEYYELIADRLSENGVASLWFHIYGLDCSSVFSVFRAAANAFNQVLIFNVSSDLYMLGSNRKEPLLPKPIPLSLQRFEKDFFSLSGVPFTEDREKSYHQFLDSVYVMNRSDILSSLRYYEVNRDDNQFLQFVAGRTFWQQMSCNDLPALKRSMR